ncbi:hypothetical protein UlMin_017536 [Ulmus minor]
MVAPYVGMVFKSDDDAFEYYGNFARKNGFSIRKERSRLSPQLGIYKRDFVCYRSGFAPAKKKPTGEHHRDRKSVRCGCDAKMYLSKEVVDGVSQWFVVQFSNVHNHELLEDDQVRLLPAYRKIHEADQERILLLSKAGFTIHRIVKVLELEKGIQGGQLPFLERDVRNFVQNRKKVVQENDALLTEKRENDTMELLEACKTMKEADEAFIYDFSVDENDKVENVAWSYADSVHGYSMFGDVVYFDISYRSITYGMLFGAWLGIDNHGRTIFFGCVLLQDETARSFSWALQTFVRFMGGRCPQTILTDLDPGLRDAMCALPSIKHVVPVWNIVSKVSSWFSHPLGSRYAEFKSELDAIFRLENTEEFELHWSQVAAMFELSTDKHISLLYSFRASWAPSYTRGYYLARMATAGYSKSVDAFLKGIFSSQTCLRSFFEQVGVSANFQHQARQEIQYMHTKTCLPIEEHARSILTPFAFNALQHELVLAMQYAISEMANNGSYIVRHFKKMDGECLVLWIPEDEQIHCSCKEFESSGLLCRHALRVFIVKNYFQLPEKYYLNRWRKESSLVFYDENGIQNGDDEWLQEYQCLTESLFTESSITKERSDYARRELTKELARILNEIRSMPEIEAIAMDVTLSPTG